MSHPSPPTLGELAHAAIGKYLQQVTKYEKAVLADRDPEDLHQMRVGLRRLRTAQQVFAAGLNLPRPGREAQVAKVARKLGELRDLDVIRTTLTEQFAPQLPASEQVVLADWMARYHTHRRQVFKQVKQRLQGKGYKHLKRALQAWLQTPDLKPLAALPATMTIPDIILPLVSELWLHPGWLVGTQPQPGGLTVNPTLAAADTNQLVSEQSAVLHSLRKQVKRVRYQLRLVAPMYGPALETEIQRLSDLQTVLGDLQDSQVLALIVEALHADAQLQMPTLFAQLAAQRHRAWLQWQTYQQHYLEPAHRQQLRLMLSQPAGQSLPPEAAVGAKPARGRAAKSKARGTAKPKPLDPPTDPLTPVGDAAKS